jgi:1-deoxy-D-xylulose-5-phosphate reductoisomerase
MAKQLVILGSTGSIGCSALDVVAHSDGRIDVLGLSTHNRIDLLTQQIEQYHPKFIAITDHSAYLKFKQSYTSIIARLLDFGDGIEKLSTLPDADIILNAIVGAAGLQASISALKAGKRLALANKESMVIGGSLINDLLNKTDGELIPIDSEHSAIWQAMMSGKRSEIKKILLTGSGGPFRDTPLPEFRSITKKQALNHPVWKMGPKITIDSATMMNKGLEVIEAMYLFGLPPDKIEVVIHPQSIIHSMVEFIDSSVIAQMSCPDMRLPIRYALFYPERVASDNGCLNLADIGHLTFERPDFEKFPLLQLAYKVGGVGGTAPAVFNAANEAAVAAFLGDTIEFYQIPDIIINAVERHKVVANPSFEDIIEADQWGRNAALENIG